MTNSDTHNTAPEPARPSVTRSTALMATATLASRITGLIRTWAMAFALGNTLLTSAYQVANNLPTIIFELVAGGLLVAAFMPLYIQQIEKHGKLAGDRYASNLLNMVVILLGALSLVATLFAPQIIATQTFTVDPYAAVNLYAVLFFRIFAIQMLFYGLGGVFTSVLNAHRVFFVTALAPLFNNVVVILSLFAFPAIFSFDPILACNVLAIGTTLGVVVQFAVQIPALIKLGFKYSVRIDLRDPAFLDTIKLALPTILYVAGSLVSFSFRNAFALSTGDDGASTLNYAWTWFQLPYGIIAMSLSRALFTEMSEAYAKNDIDAFKRHLKSGLSGMMFIIIPIAGLMFILAAPMMQIFRAGAFRFEDVAYVGSIIQIWVFALPFYCVKQFLFNVYSSIRRFALYSLISTGLCVIQCLLYAYLTQESLMSLNGIPAADIIYYGFSTLVLLVVLQRKIGQFGSIAVLATALKTMLATIFGVIFCGVLVIFFSFGGGIVAGLCMVVLYGGISLVLILLICALLRVAEVKMVLDLLKTLRRKLFAGR